MMSAMGIAICCLEPIIVVFLWCTTRDKFKKHEKAGYKCQAGFLGFFTVLQLICVISFFVNYGYTDKEYSSIMASSAQLSDFNGCGDAYMQIDKELVFAKLKQSQNSLNTCLLVGLIALLSFAIQSVCVVFRLLRLAKPPLD